MPTLHPCARRRSPKNINNKSIVSAAGIAAALIMLLCVFVAKHTSNSGSYCPPIFSFQARGQSTVLLQERSEEAGTNLP